MKTGQIHWPSVLQFVLTGLVILNLWGGAAILAMIGISGLMIGGVRDSSFTDPLPLFLMAAVMAATGFLLLPSGYYALWRALGWQALDFRPFLAKLQPALWILILPVVLLLGYGASNSSGFAWLLLPPFHLLAVSLPVGWILFLSVRGLPLGSPQRMWGVLSSGLILAPALILILEGIAGLVFLLFVAVSITSHPDLVKELTRLVDWISAANPSPEAVVEAVKPFVMRPGVIFSILAFGAIVVPLIEEAIKPMGVWLLAGRKISPAAGFAAGAMSGAGYALFESLVLVGDGQQWVSLVVARIGTAAIHIFTSGLTGWALVQVWHKRRYGLLGASYLIAVLIHGLWNALTLVFSFTAMAGLQSMEFQIPYFFELGQVAPFGLVFLALGAFSGLLWANRSLRIKDERSKDISSQRERKESVL